MRTVPLLLLIAACGEKTPGDAPPGTTDTSSTAIPDPCVTGTGCTSAPTGAMTVSAPGSDPGTLDSTGIVVEVVRTNGTFDQQRFRMRQVHLDSTSPTTVAITGDAFALLDSTGADLGSSASIPAGATDLYVTASADGVGHLTLDGLASFDIPLTSRAFPGLSGRSLAEYPWFEYVTDFNDGDDFQVALDPTRFPDRIGLAFDVHVVPHRALDAWVADNSLTASVLSGAATVVPGSTADNTFSVGVLPAGPDPATAYDVVFDFDRDGLLGPGDLLDGGEVAGAVAAIDLTTPGPYTPMSFEYSTGVWTTMRIYTPDDPGSVPGLMPLVVISHGNGHLYTWYDYLGNFLASWGYVVMAHTNNTGPGIDTASTTTLTNTETFLRDLPILGGGVLDGHVDPNTIVWIGHSRGGEGVVHAYNKLVNDIGPQPTTFDENDVIFLSSIAPTMFQGTDETNPHDRNYHIISGTRDGDVTGSVSGGDVTQYYAIFQPGTGEHLVTLVHGADHNDFNCCGFEDSDLTSGPGEIIGRPKAQMVAKSYYLALLDHYVWHRDELFDFLWRSPDRFKPISAPAVLANEFIPAKTAAKFVIDDFQGNPDVALSSSGGAVASTVSGLVEGPLDDANSDFTWKNSDPMNGMTWSNDDPRPERGIVFTADVGTSLDFSIVADQQDFSDDTWLTFRACQGTRHPVVDSTPASFVVTLTDANGIESSVDFGAYGSITAPYARTGDGVGTGWFNEFGTVRIRLTDFEADGSGIDLSAITSVKLTFGGPGQVPQRIGLDDLMVVP
jgi:hypothetical protein